MDLNRLWLLILLISVREIIAFPPLVTRGDGSLLDPIVDPVLGAIGGALTWGVGATIDGLSNLNNIPAPSPSLDQIPVPAADPAAAPAVDPSSPSTEQVPIPAADPAAPPSVEPSVNPAAERAPDTGMNPNTPVDQSQGTQGAQTYHLGIQNTQGTSSDVQLETNPSAQLPGNQKCEAALPSTGKGSPPELNSDPCNVPSRQIIYPIECELSGQAESTIFAQTRAIRNGLTQMVGPTGFRTISRRCGVFFFTASLTYTQIQTLREIDPSPTIVPDGSFDIQEDASPQLRQRNDAADGSFDIENNASTEFPLMQKRGRLQKRKDAADLVQQVGAYQDLQFISTPPRPPVNPAVAPGYWYIRKKKDPTKTVIVYLIDTGVEPQAGEFRRESANGETAIDNVIRGWLYTEDAEVGETDPDPNGHGTCVASKIAGLTNGVDKDGNLIVVKTTNWQSSVLNALSKIISDLERRGMGKGFAIVNISMGWQSVYGENEKRMAKLIRRLVEEFQVVIVVSTGDDQTRSNQPIDFYPALFSLDMPIITVGAVQPYGGATLPFSMSGPGLTVSGPAYVKCSYGSPGFHNDKRRSGTGYAAAVVSGVISTWLSDDYGEVLRRDPTRIPQAVLDLVKKLSYVRDHGTDPGIWNGVDSENPASWPPTDPPKTAPTSGGGWWFRQR